MNVDSIQQNFGNGLLELETGATELTAIDPNTALIEIQQTKNIIMDTQVRLANVLNQIRTNEVDIESSLANQTNQVINNLNELQEIGAMNKNKKEIKAFNLKKMAQLGMQAPPVPFGADDFTDMGELGEERYDIEKDFQDEGLNRQAFTDFLKSLSQEPDELIQFVKNNTPEESMEINDKLANQFNIIVDDPTKIDEVDQIAGQIYDNLIDAVKTIPENTEMGIPTVVSETDDIIRKIAKKIAKKPSKPFNLTKTAQHKTSDDVIMYGPGHTRIDPFYMQPVSDWSIIERNKGFGLTFGDVWDVDYEAIWRESIMDKYFRAYRDKDGNWVGGYINKRFEVDRNIPPTNNYQLKPDEIRRATPPEYGVTESRLQASRANGDIEGGPDVNRSKPFNWQKEASSKKKN